MAEFDLSSLSNPVLAQLFKMLPVSDRCRLASSNRRFATIMDTPNMWREITIDEFDLHIKSNNYVVPWDFSMIKKYDQHFEKVKVVMHTGLIESQSLAVLTELGKRHVIKSVSLRLDRFLSKVMNWEAEKGPAERDQIHSMWTNFVRTMVISSPESENQTGRGIMHPPASHLIDNVSPDADFTIAIPPQSHDIKDFFKQGFNNSYLNIHFCAVVLYYSHLSEKCCSQLKKLILSPLPVPEEAIASDLSHLMGGAPLSPLPTVKLISSFPNLQELHVNIINLSDQLLLQLSGFPERQKPLRRLVIRHIVCDCEVERMSDTYRLLSFTPWNIGTFPQLSSDSWDRLAQYSPSLTVECSVVSDKLPLLLDVIKPETPLFRLEVLCRTTSSDDQSVPVLQELSKIHSRLTIVGVRFHACICTNADS